LAGQGASEPPRLRRELGAFDFTLLVVGAVIGADVYIVAAMGAGFLGPAQLVAWVAAGVLAAVIALAFVQCAAIFPEVGGSYAYARAAFGPRIGFLAGWALYVGEWVALPIFPLAFVNYLGYFSSDLGPVGGNLAKVLLIAAVTLVNLLGVRIGGRANDVLTLAKLVPLGLLIVTGLVFTAVRTDLAVGHLLPFAPLGWSGFGSAVLLIFWAYGGFELAVLPASEVTDPRRTLPHGLIVGMVIATIFYLLTSFAVVVALPWQAAASSPRSLADAMGTVLEELGFSEAVGMGLMSLGGLISIASVYEVFTLGLARLSYAMAKDGLLPPVFARVHSRVGTPHVGLLFQAGSALVFSLLFDLPDLISIAVFFLGLCYTVTALSALRLIERAPEGRLRLPALRGVLVLAALSGAYLSLQAPARLIAIGMAVILVGLALFGWQGGGWQETAALRAELEEGEHRFEEWAHRWELWLLQLVRRR
jgi:amino acid transporter